MHYLLLSSEILKSVLETIILKRPNEFVFHLLCDFQIDIINCTQTLTFQANYANNFYTSFKISTDKLLFFDPLEFRPIVLNYTQCIKLLQLCTMFKNTIAIGYNESEELIEIVVSQSNVKLVFKIDNEIDHNPIIPPEHNLEIPYINLKRELLYNVIKLVQSSEFYTPIRVDSKKRIIIFGDEFQSIVKILDSETNLKNSEIEINPDSISLFLENVKVENVNIKINESIAFIIHFSTELGEVYYYRGHEI